MKEDQAARRRLADAEAEGGWRVHTAEDTASRTAAVRPKNGMLICPGVCRHRVAAGSGRTRQVVAATAAA